MIEKLNKKKKEKEEKKKKKRKRTLGEYKNLNMLIHMVNCMGTQLCQPWHSLFTAVPMLKRTAKQVSAQQMELHCCSHSTYPVIQGSVKPALLVFLTPPNFSAVPSLSSPSWDVPYVPGF